MSLRSPADNENGNPCRCIRFRPLPPRPGEDRDGGAETRSKITPTLPSPSRGRIKSALSLSFAPRLNNFRKSSRRTRSYEIRKYQFPNPPCQPEADPSFGGSLSRALRGETIFRH